MIAACHEATALPPTPTPVPAAAQTAAAGQPASPAATAQPAALSPSTQPATTTTTDTSFNPPSLAPGYQRFELAAIDVASGDSYDWAQWVGGPLDQDYDVVDIAGEQSVGGHHALMYATTEAQAPGFTRLWQDADQLTTRLMGGIGGEGGAKANLPPGVVFRVKKGSYLMVQTHYLNSLDHSIVGRTILDVKMSPVDKAHRVASIMANTTPSINLPPGQPMAVDVYCPIQEDLRFIKIANHMHDYGKTSLTEYTDPAGALHTLKDDTSWSGEMALNPNFSDFSPDAPAIVPAGSMLHTHCTWQNTSATNVKFPSEMCVFFGFVLSEYDIYCTNGRWAAGMSTTDSATATAGAPATAGVPAATSTAGAAGAALPATGAGAAGASAPVAAGSSATTDATAIGCTSAADQAIMNAPEFDGKSTDCSVPCGLDPNVAACTTPCFQNKVGLSPACAACNAANVACGAKNCLSACLADSASPECRSCVMANCDAPFHACTGT